MVQQIARKTLLELFGQYQASFNPAAWNWPRETRRRVGVVGSPRNIVDTGSLRQSGTYNFIGPYTLEARWSAGYATAVHEGAPRPWTDAVSGAAQAPGIPVYPLGQKLQQRIQVAVARG